MTRPLFGLAAAVCLLHVGTGVTAYRSGVVEDAGDTVVSLIMSAALAGFLLGMAAVFRSHKLAVAALLPAVARVGCGVPGVFVVLDGGRPFEGWAAYAELFAGAVLIPLIVAGLLTGGPLMISGRPDTSPTAGEVSEPPEVASAPPLRRAVPD
ncbi:MAG: hypothetical protein HOV76_31440 [Hamadaea sp.]|nr:hypothetical protein [Hamadaea sp.]